jgi:hypothetical protein
MKPIDLQYSYKKQIGFTKQQKKAFQVLEKHNVNINQFIREAIIEKLKREWKSIKENKTKEYCPF